MVVADQGLADVVFVIEGTANLNPYVESLRSNYIFPTLEYFNGGPPDDRDCGNDANSTMYALVTFMAADCAPETASTCFGPTGNPSKFLSWLDKVNFIGGAGESFSHIAEGLSTALQAFDDFQTQRENINTQKHCILICNSPPYPLPALESITYSGYQAEQLAAMMAERQINLSVLSPRKIPPLFKLYEKGGGDLPHALTKNYGKDRRHLVLLRGFQLQERPLTPPAIDSKAGILANSSVCSPPSAGQKRPATNSPPNSREFKQPATQGYNAMDWNMSDASPNAPGGPNQIPSPMQQMNPGQPGMNYGPNVMAGQPNQGMPQRPMMPNAASHLNPLNQPNPPNVTITNKGPPQHPEGIRPPRGHSPVSGMPGGPRLPWNQPNNPSSPVGNPPTTSVLATQLNMGPGNLNMRPQMVPPNQSVGGGIVQQGQPMNQAQNVLNAGNLRANLSNMGMRMSASSPASAGQLVGNNNTLATQLQQHPQFAQNPQLSAQQAAQVGKQQAGGNVSAAAALGVPGGTPKDRRTIWTGILEFLEKTNSPQQTRVSYSLTCTISSIVTNGDPDVNAEKWPNKLNLQLIPKPMIVAANLFGILKTNARHVLMHFSQSTEALLKLCKNMSAGLVGCVMFPPTCDIRIMVVLYMPDKQIYMGFIAHDQEGFYNSIRQIYENHRKMQQKTRVQLQNTPSSTTDAMGMPLNNMAPNVVMGQQPGNAMPAAANNQINMPNQMNIPLQQQQQQPGSTQPNVGAQQNMQTMGAPQGGPPPNQTMGQQQSLNQANQARLSQLESARQQNLLKIQQLQQTLEAAQQKELQYKAAQEQQKQQQQQQMIDKQNVIRHLQQQLQQQQQQQQQLHQQSLQMNQQMNQQMNMNQQTGHNPQLRNLLQPMIQQQQLRRQHQQMVMQQQIPQPMRAQIPGNMPQVNMGQAVGQQQQQSQQTQQQNQQWGDLNILDSLPP